MEDEESRAIQWLEGAAAGDRSAFAKLYDTYAGPLYSMALRLVGSPETAREVMQDTFLAVWKHAGAYDSSRGKVFTWMVMILRRKAIDRLRFESRRLPGPVSESPTAELSINEDTPATQAENQDRSQIIAGLLQDLPDDQRQMLELAFLEGWTHKEIASNLSQPLGTVKSRIRLALQRLRTRMKEGGHE